MGRSKPCRANESVTRRVKVSIWAPKELTSVLRPGKGLRAPASSKDGSRFTEFGVHRGRIGGRPPQFLRFAFSTRKAFVCLYLRDVAGSPLARLRSPS